MDSTKKHVKKSPEENANFLSKLLFCWFLPFFKFGYKNEVKFSDIYNAAKVDLSGPLGDKLERLWFNEINSAKKNNNKPQLKKALLKTFIASFIPIGISIGIQFLGIRMIQPLILSGYIGFFRNYRHTTDNTIGWCFAAAIIGIGLLHVIMFHQSNLVTQRIGMRIRIAVCSLIYRKLLRLNHSSLSKTAAGQLVNFLSNDVQRFDVLPLYLHFIWIMPFSVGLSIYILNSYVGIWATLAAMGFVSIQSLPMQGFLSKVQGSLRYKIALRTDSRVKLMNEITSGIQVIKMYAWEKPFEKVVQLYRKLEIDKVSTTSYIYGAQTSMAVYTERVTLFLTLVTFVLIGNGQLSGDVAFALAQLFNSVQAVMVYFFPRALFSYAEVSVSIKRIEEFLLLEEKELKPRISKDISMPIKEVGTVNLIDVSATWKPDCILPTISNFNLSLKPGTLCCIVGHVGSGKSSILQLLLNELPIISGEMNTYGTISYSSQEPWLFVSSVRDNILFGKPYLKERYKEVVKVCNLDKDFHQFPRGDKTLVAEKGTSLSGGQKARVNLARAIYNDADIYLLDDPLSAVDTEVGKHLFNSCIVEYLKGKTRILVTHQLQFMKKADLIIILNNGQIEKMGTFEELSEKELNVLQGNTEEVIDMKKEKEKYDANNILEEKIISSLFLQSNMSLKSSEGEPEELEEFIAKGGITNATYWEYFNSGNKIFYLAFTAFMFFFAQVVTNSSDLWLSNWTNVETRRYIPALNISAKHFSYDSEFNTTSTISAIFLNNRSNSYNNSKQILLENPELESPTYYILVYTGLIVVSVILLTIRSFLYFKVCMNSSKALHNKMFHNILEAPMRFYDTNPSGRILNRFSKDMGAIDELLPRCQIDSIQIFMVMFGILAMVFIISPWMIVPTLILVPIYFYGRKVYLATSQAVKRFEGSSRAPVFSHVTASLYGISTIRASNAEKMVIDEFDILQDQHTSTWFLFLVSSEAFGTYLDLISIFFLALVTFQFLIFRNENTLSGNVGLAISHTMILTGMLQFGIRQSSEVASNMVSVERVLQYTKLDKEGPFQSLPTKAPPRDWPEKGRILFQNVYLRYAHELPPVLKNLNIEINSGEKIGIVGRTGAGKSTLIASLFRLAPIDGTITIDGIDTSEIGLNDLRLNISIIPQEPVLFSASIRYNLDPFEKQTDDDLWRALENVELKDVIKDLNQMVTEGGSNFSVGQRQLICLARAIVRNNKILVMDEATANVDPQTDSFIQKTIREKFKDCTVLTIAHRLNTIMDSDRVLVMDAGQSVEYDHPHKLLLNTDGYFSKLVKETGPAMEQNLKKIAENTYKAKKVSTKENQQSK